MSDIAPEDLHSTRDRKGGIMKRAEGNTETGKSLTKFKSVQQVGTGLSLSLGLTNMNFNLCDSGRLGGQSRDQLERAFQTRPRPGMEQPGIEPDDWMGHPEVGGHSQSQQPGQPGTSLRRGTASQQLLASVRAKPRN